MPSGLVLYPDERGHLRQIGEIEGVDHTTPSERLAPLVRSRLKKEDDPVGRAVVILGGPAGFRLRADGKPLLRLLTEATTHGMMVECGRSGHPHVFRFNPKFQPSR